MGYNSKHRNVTLGGNHAIRRVIIGHGGFREQVVHNVKRGKYYVSPDVTPARFWPSYVYGAGYVISSNALQPLYNAIVDAKTQPKMWLEDLYVTGIARRQAEVNIVFDKRFKILLGKQPPIGQVPALVTLADQGNGDRFKRNWNWFVKALNRTDTIH